MSRSIGLAHIVRQPDGTSAGVWGVFMLKTAFQPIFAFRGGKLEIRAFEGLIRPFRNGEPVPPPAFFSAISSIDRFHVETLTRTLHLLNAGACLDPAADIFVNFDPSLFGDREVADVAIREMRLVLHEAGIAPGRVTCEMIEKRSASEDVLARLVQLLRSHGFRIAVDDYGADDSDIRRIEELCPDVVKFDARWITRLMESDPGLALLKAMVTTFRDRGIVTIFEGIEEQRQLELAEQTGVDMVQGFVLARPQIVPLGFAGFPIARGDDRSADQKEALEKLVRADRIKPPKRQAAVFGRRRPAS